jgi:8-amino-7-oxononanoate synthase
LTTSGIIDVFRQRQRVTHLAQTEQAGVGRGAEIVNTEWIGDILDDLRQQGLLRRLPSVTSPPGPEIEIDGRPVLQFASNDYLSLAADPRLAEAAGRAAREFGTGSTASRLIVGTGSLVTELERRLADLKHTEAALVLPTGYMANLALVTSLVGPGDAVLVDRLCHASILDAIALARARLITFRHNDPDALRKKLTEKAGYARRLVMTESVFSMDGDVAPLGDLAAVAEQHGAMFAVDEAHATGVFGTSGAGLAEEQGVPPERITATVGTLSKALGGLGGFITTSQPVADLLVNRARSLIFTTGIPPAQAATALAALEVVHDEPERRDTLRRRAESLRGRLAAMGLDVGASASQIVPIIVGDAAQAVAMSEALWDRGLFVPAIRPPSVPKGTSRLRISLQYAHTGEHIDRLVAAVTEAMKSEKA